MSYGQYTLNFAGNERVRAYFYGKDPVIALKDEKSIARSSSNTIKLRSNFNAFYDCINMIKASKESPIHGVKCEFVRDIESIADLNDLRYISIGPSKTKECKINYVPDENSVVKSFFNITMKQKYVDMNFLNKRYNEDLAQHTGHLLVLTCSPPYAEYSSHCTSTHEQTRSCGVTFAVPFILDSKSSWMKNQYFKSRPSDLQNTIIIAITLSVIFIFSVILALMLPKLFKIRKRKR